VVALLGPERGDGGDQAPTLAPSDIVDLGIDLGTVVTRSSPADAFAYALRR
jgi:hypothetical protein